MADFSPYGQISPSLYQGVFEIKKRRIDRLLSLLKAGQFLGIHVGDTNFLDKDKVNHFQDLVALSEFFKAKFSVSDFTIVCFNLAPSDCQEGNVVNFSNNWNIYRDTNEAQRQFVRQILVDEFGLPPHGDELFHGVGPDVR